jgi:8-oxo-dGTP diphosphatase
LEKDGKVLLLRNAFDKSIGVWDLPGGRLHIDEQPIDGVKREILEELGVEIEVKGIVYADQHRKTKNNELTLLLVYLAVLKDPTKDFVFDPDEVEEIVWVKFSDLDSYKTFGNIELALKTYYSTRVA